MTLRPIRTKAAHAAALKAIEKRWNVEPGTPAHDELDVLGILVEAYEREHTPMGPPTEY
jgi:HTH-type transcriptional regulator/antitoxin HigA